MKKLINGILDFRKNLREARKDEFARLALGQRPDTLFIACSDSRVVPNLFASTDPGDLFVIRNVGNLVPPSDAQAASSGNDGEAAALEFSLLSLPITEIVVCGHSECGAMEALVRGRVQPEALALQSWLRHGDGSLRKLQAGDPLGAHLERHNQLSQINVVEQLEHLQSYPVVAQRLATGRLRLHGWWFDIKGADVYEYERSEARFRLIDEGYAGILLERANATTR